MYEYKIQKEGFREDGYYTATVKVWDKENKDLKKFRIEVVYGKRVPSERFKIAEIERRIVLLDDQPILEPEKLYTAQEVTEILHAKGYLEVWEEFGEDMPDVDHRPPEPEPEPEPEPDPPL